MNWPTISLKKGTASNPALTDGIFMTIDNIEQAISDLPPDGAAGELVEVLKKLFSVIDEKERIDLVMNLFGEATSGKTGSMVHR